MLFPLLSTLRALGCLLSGGGPVSSLPDPTPGTACPSTSSLSRDRGLSEMTDGPPLLLDQGVGDSADHTLHSTPATPESGSLPSRPCTPPQTKLPCPPSSCNTPLSRPFLFAGENPHKQLGIYIFYKYTCTSIYFTRESLWLWRGTGKKKKEKNCC